MTFLDSYMAPDLMHNLTPQAIRGYNHLNTLLFRVDVRDVTEEKVISALRGEAVEFDRNDVKDADIRVFIQEAIAIRGVLPPEVENEKPLEVSSKALSTEEALAEANRLSAEIAAASSNSLATPETEEEEDEND